jgi:hypothetical protein
LLCVCALRYCPEFRTVQQTKTQLCRRDVIVTIMLTSCCYHAAVMLLSC